MTFHEWLFHATPELVAAAVLNHRKRLAELRSQVVLKIKVEPQIAHEQNVIAALREVLFVKLNLNAERKRAFRNGITQEIFS